MEAIMVDSSVELKILFSQFVDQQQLSVNTLQSTQCCSEQTKPAAFLP
jgi:hypothetical protein